MLAAALAFVASASAADFGAVRVRAPAARGDCGAVVLRPFPAAVHAVVPLFVLADAGDYARPWLRARRVARALPAVVARLVAGQRVKVGADADGQPALFVGRAGPPAPEDLEVVSVLPGDAARFAREPGAPARLTAADVARYWQQLLEDVVTVFFRFPLERDLALAERLHLDRTRSGLLFKRVMVEVGVLLRYEDVTLEAATAAQVQAKTREVLDAFTPEQWSTLAGLALHVPAELETTTRGSPEASAEPGPGPLVPIPPVVATPDPVVWPGHGDHPPSESALRAGGEKPPR